MYILRFSFFSVILILFISEEKLLFNLLFIIGNNFYLNGLNWGLILKIKFVKSHSKSPKMVAVIIIIIIINYLYQT